MTAHASRHPLTDEQWAAVGDAIGIPGALSSLAREWGLPAGRLYSAASHLSRVRAKRPNAARRTCLCCGRKFQSAWIGNRICDGCKEANHGVMA